MLLGLDEFVEDFTAYKNLAKFAPKDPLKKYQV
jgi:hypothetical protein